MTAKDGQCEEECAWEALQDLQIAGYSESSLNRLLAEKLSNVNMFFANEFSVHRSVKPLQGRKTTRLSVSVRRHFVRKPGMAGSANCWRVSHYFAFATVAARGMFGHRIARNQQVESSSRSRPTREISAAKTISKRRQEELCE